MPKGDSTEVTADEVMGPVKMGPVNDREHAVVLIVLQNDPYELSIRSNVGGKDLFEVIGVALHEHGRKVMQGQDGVITIGREGGVRITPGATPADMDAMSACRHATETRTPDACSCGDECWCRTHGCPRPDQLS